MTESLSSLEESSLEGSDQLPDCFCKLCNKVKPVAGHCKNCNENLCSECFTSHCEFKLFRSHKLVKSSPRPNLQPTTKKVFNNDDRKCNNNWSHEVKRVMSVLDLSPIYENRTTIDLTNVRERLGNYYSTVRSKDVQNLPKLRTYRL